MASSDTFLEKIQAAVDIATPTTELKVLLVTLKFQRREFDQAADGGSYGTFSPAAARAYKRVDKRIQRIQHELARRGVVV